MPGISKKKLNNTFGERDALLDPVNLRLLAALHADPRISMTQLAKQVSMSAPAVTERVQRMQRTGIIVGFHMDVDPAALGMPVTALVRIKPGPAQLPKLIEAVQKMPQVTECHRITGEDCLFVKVHVPSIARLDETLDQFLLYGQTTTSIIQSTPVPPRPLPVTHD
ncbi:Lrp/AsnC family transcriptional regulator [Stackebrandtia nassauensis]|uniref:Transcriptional regulator, AsnC family n=1 Tax=Stackebrandtia nassauensis (strain DSM 44728 / CIP 108903 / NRRL B-16338 / NBRC 102104 / LLR-40K-21) TaxID=446470 RepID=D3PZ95_STANL|nr:Lrp/AsnC family transcriptional regulator [Stackebrandtia nassauensis]ADD41569.1 transcriptional regulator, AsnC family [Stackebrandtia nassauensis DSM 44728]